MYDCLFSVAYIQQKGNVVSEPAAVSHNAYIQLPQLQKSPRCSKKNDKYLTPPDEHLNCWHTKQTHKMAADNKYKMRLSNTSTITTSEKGQKGNKDIWMLTWGQKSLFLVCIQSHIQNLLPLLSSVCGKHFLNMTCVQGCCTKLLHNMTLIYQQSTGTCGVLVLFPAGGGNV